MKNLPKTFFNRAINDRALRDRIYKKTYNASKSFQNSWANLNHGRNILGEICRSQGTPSIFVTLSSAEHKWDDLKNLLCPDNYQWDGEYTNKTDMVKKTGYLSTLLLKEKFEKVTNYINSYFQVEWDFQRIEVQ